MSSVSDPRFRPFQHLQIPQDLLADLASTVAEKKGKLFVHCEAGVNRSGALCLAYHLSSSQVGLVDSAKHCQLARLGDWGSFLGILETAVLGVLCGTRIKTSIVCNNDICWLIGKQDKIETDRI
jgi:hypothetical protein